MFLSNKDLASENQWISKNYEIPVYDRKLMTEKTLKNPTWIHFGAGNIFRAFQSNIMEKLLNSGFYDKGLIVAEGYDYEIIEKAYRPYDNFSLLVTYCSDGNIKKKVIGSIAESLIVEPTLKSDYDRLVYIFESSSLQMASFTITEKGYCLKDSKGVYFENIKNDFENGPLHCKSYIGKISSLLYARYKAGKKPIAMVSMDNCSHNGDLLADAVLQFAKKWYDNNLTDNGFVNYLSSKKYVSFPWTMIDKITPRPDKKVEELLVNDGIENINISVTNKNTFIAPFVNAEEKEYLVIEDCFPNGRPPLEKAGVYFTDRETVEKVECMKVSTCLNPLHTALAVTGCLLGYERIYDEMNDMLLRKMVEKLAYDEGLPVVVNPKIIAPKDFLNTVINDRLSNPFLPDSPQRIATDTSQKISVRFGITISSYFKSKKIDQLEIIPLILAMWLRYLKGIDDNGEKFQCSPDPMLNNLRAIIEKIPFNVNYDDAKNFIQELLKDKNIFGVDLWEVGIANKVCKYFCMLMSGKGAVRNTLHTVVNQV